MKKRILQFIGSFHQGGSERQAVGLTRLLKNGDSFEVFAATLNNEGVLRSEIDEVGLPATPEFPLTSFYNANFVRQVRQCARYITDHKIDLVHTHDFYTNVFGMAAATLAGVQVRIASKRETDGMRSGAQRSVEKISFATAHAILVNSASVRDHLLARGLPLEKIHLIYNGIDLDRFGVAGKDREAIRKQCGLPVGENIRLITLVANLRHTVKNVPMLLATAKRVVEIQPNVHFVVAGEGGLESELRGAAERLGVADKVHFIGRCAAVPELLSMSYACVLTSTAEGFSNSILEYMAAGKPVVATDVGGAAEAIVNGETGFLVDSGDDVAMAERINELLTDGEMAARFGGEGKLVVGERFSEEAQLRQTVELYNSLLNVS